MGGRDSDRTPVEGRKLSFFILLGDQAGYPIDLESLDPDAFLNAMIASFEGDEQRLAAVFRGLVKA